MTKLSLLACFSRCLGPGLILPILCTAQVPFAGDFQSEIRYAASTWSIAAGDFNGDGRMDFVASSSDNTIVVFLGNGDGTFQTPVFYSVNDPLGVAIGDLNGDGKLDVVVTNFNSLATTFGGGVSIFFGNGDGTFQPPVFYSTGKNPTAAAIGDLNGDGKPDLVVTDVTSGNVSVMLNTGAGVFAAPVQFATGSYPNSVAIDDINRDGHNDIVVTNSCVLTPNPSGCSGSSPNTISVLLGNGDGTFSNPVSYSAGAGPFQLALGDLNADSWPDVVVTNNLGNSVTVLLNKGDGTFGTPTSYLIGHTPLSVAIADFNGDSKPDLVATTRDLTLVELLGNGDGTFRSGINYFSGTTFLGVAVADLNGDSAPDLIAGTGQFTVGAFLNAAGKSRAQTSITLSPSRNPGSTLTDIVVHAQVTSSGPAPKGSVSFYVDGILVIGQNIGVLDTSGQTSLDLGCQPMGTHTISAIYSGDTLTAGSVSSLLTETTNLHSVSVVLSSSLNPSVEGATVTFTGAPAALPADLDFSCAAEITGTLTFSDGGNVLGTSPLVFTAHNPEPYASLSVSTLSAGSHEITAFYSGDQNFATATSIPLAQVVNAAPSVGVSPSTISFGNQMVNKASPAQAITLSNVGSVPLAINGITTSSADFTQNNNCGSTLVAKAACTINATFTASGIGFESAILSISDNALGSPHTVALSGTGISLGLAVSPGSSGSATVSAGQSTSFNLSIGGAGFNGTATIACNLVAAGASCSVHATVTVNETTAANFVVGVSTSPRSMALLGFPRSLSPNWLWSVIFLGLLTLPRTKCRGAIALGLLLVLLSSGCGGGSSSQQQNPTGTPAGAYNLTVVAKSGAVSQSITLTLVVQ
jgi:hypothetical protein